MSIHKPGAAVATLSLVVVALAAMATPPADAHWCRSSEPSHGCGDCKDRSSGTDPYHKHLYNDDSLYCESGPCCDSEKVALLLQNPTGVPLP